MLLLVPLLHPHMHVKQSTVQLNAINIQHLGTASLSCIPLLLAMCNRFQPTSTLRARIITAVAVGCPLGTVLALTVLPEAAASSQCTLLLTWLLCAAVLMLLQAYSDMTASAKLVSSTSTAAAQSKLILGRYSRASVLYCAAWVSISVLCTLDNDLFQCSLTDSGAVYVPLLRHVLVAAGLKLIATAVLQPLATSSGTTAGTVHSRYAIETQQYLASLLSVLLAHCLSLMVILDATAPSQRLLRAALVVPAAGVWLLLLQSHSATEPQAKVYSRNGHALLALYTTWCVLSLLETSSNTKQMSQWRQLFEVSWLALTAYGCIDTVKYAWCPEQHSTQQQLSWRTLIMAAVPVASSVYTNTLNYACALICIWIHWRTAPARKAALSVI
jgi:hypothetical protein